MKYGHLYLHVLLLLLLLLLFLPLLLPPAGEQSRGHLQKVVTRTLPMLIEVLEASGPAHDVSL